MRGHIARKHRQWPEADIDKAYHSKSRLPNANPLPPNQSQSHPVRHHGDTAFGSSGAQARGLKIGFSSLSSPHSLNYLFVSWLLSQGLAPHNTGLAPHDDGLERPPFLCLAAGTGGYNSIRNQRAQEKRSKVSKPTNWGTEANKPTVSKRRNPDHKNKTLNIKRK